MSALGTCACGADLDEVKREGKFGHVCSKLPRLDIAWECFFCDATHEDTLRCRIIYVHKSDDAVVCQHCDKGAEVTDDIVRRAMLVEKLKREMLEDDDQTRSAAERAYRRGHNDRNRTLIEALS